MEFDDEVARLVAELDDDPRITQQRARIQELNEQILRLRQELAQATTSLREIEEPSYSGLGARIENLLRLAEEQASELVSGALAEAAQIRAAAEHDVEETLATAARNADLATKSQSSLILTEEDWAMAKSSLQGGSPSILLGTSQRAIDEAWRQLQGRALAESVSKANAENTTEATRQPLRKRPLEFSKQLRGDVWVWPAPSESPMALATLGALAGVAAARERLYDEWFKLMALKRAGDLTSEEFDLAWAKASGSSPELQITTHSGESDRA